MMTLPKTNFRKFLLAGTAIVAIGAFGSSDAFAASQEMDNADGAAAEAAYADPDVITNTVDDAANFLHVELGADADDQITSIDSNFDGTLFITDGDANNPNDFDVSSFVDIADSTTLTVIFGNDTADSSGTDGLESVDFDVAGNLGEGNGTSRGGTLALLGANDITGDFDAAMTVDGSVMLTALSVTSGNGATDEGTSLTLTLGDAAGDAVDITTLTATGGNGGADHGGATAVTVTGTLADASGGIDINGGAAGAAGNGGASKITVTPAVAALSGNTTIDGGAGGTAAGVGGAAELELTGGLTAGTGNFTVTGGIGASGAGGTAAGGAATLDSDAAFTTTGTVTFAGGNGGTGATGASAGGAATGEFAASLEAAGVTLTGGNGGSGAASAGGAATAVVTTTSTIGSSGLTVTGGNGGTFAGAAVGGNAAFTSTTLATITGAINVTGGNGNDNNAADGGTATATFAAGVTATSQTLTISGGEGDDDSNGDGGNATVELNDSSTFSSIVINDGADNNATGGEAELIVDIAGAEDTITGTITAGADGEGTLTIENTEGNTNHVTFASQIGTALARLQAVVIGNGNDGAHATFSGEVHADAITVSGADDVSAAIFSEDVSVETTTGTLTITDGGSAAASATFKKDLSNGTVIMEGSAGGATATFDGSTAQTVSSSFRGNNGEEGVIMIGDGTTATDVTFSGDFGSAEGAAVNAVGTITVDGAATATFNGEVETGGAVAIGDAAASATAYFNDIFDFGSTTAIDGMASFGNTVATEANTFAGLITAGANHATTIDLAGHADLEGGLTVGAQGATLYIKKTATFDPTDSDGDGTANQATDMIWDGTGQAITTTGILTVAIDSESMQFDNGDQIVVIEGNNAANFGTEITNETIVLMGTGLIDLQNNASDADTLAVTVVLKDPTTTLSGSGIGAASTLATSLTSTTATNELATIRGNLLSAPDADAASEVAEAASPTVDGGAVVAGVSVANQTSNITNARLAALRDGETGMVAGNPHGLETVWIQGFGSTGEQDARDGIDGYDIDTYGFAMGIDTGSAGEDLTLGLALAYADSEIDSDNANATSTDVQSYQISLYGDYDIDDRTYVSGQLGYIFGDNETTRYNVGGVNGLTANADYDSDQIVARVEAGRDYKNGSATITPKVLANYLHYDADNYTETGAGNANLAVDSDTLNMFELGLGVDVSWMNQQADGSFLEPKLHAGVRHDLIGDEVESTNSFTGAPAQTFKTEGFDPAQTTMNVGAGVTYYTTDNWELTADYDYEFKSDYDSHTGVLKAAYKF